MRVNHESRIFRLLPLRHCTLCNILYVTITTATTISQIKLLWLNRCDASSRARERQKMSLRYLFVQFYTFANLVTNPQIIRFSAWYPLSAAKHSGNLKLFSIKLHNKSHINLVVTCVCIANNVCMNIDGDDDDA